MKEFMRKVIHFQYTYFGRHTPECMQSFRNLLVRGFSKQCGTNISIGTKARIHKSLIIGSNSGVGRGCEIDANVTIGNNVMMGPDVLIYSQNHRHDSVDVPMRLQGFEDRKHVVIEDDCWIGARAIILPGVRIGKGSIIGAGGGSIKRCPAL